MATQLEIELGVKVIALKEMLRTIAAKLTHNKERTVQGSGKPILWRCDLRTCLKCQTEQASKDTIEEAVERVGDAGSRRGEMSLAEKDKRRLRRTRRKWCYVQRPKDYEMAPCECGNADTDWSEWREHLWCAKCKKDFIPKHNGIFDGPVPVNASEFMGIYFDRIDLKTNKLIPDFEGKSHFKLGRPRSTNSGEKHER